MVLRNKYSFNGKQRRVVLLEQLRGEDVVEMIVGHPRGDTQSCRSEMFSGKGSSEYPGVASKMFTTSRMEKVLSPALYDVVKSDGCMQSV